MSQVPQTLGQRVTMLRERKKWTQRELAERAGISVTFLSEVENDKRNPSSDVLLRLANALNTSMDYLMKGSTPNPVPEDPLTIPPELSAAAEDQGWSHRDTVALLVGHLSLLARRTRGGEPEPQKKNLSVNDWVNLYNTYFRHA